MVVWYFSFSGLCARVRLSPSLALPSSSFPPAWLSRGWMGVVTVVLMGVVMGVIDKTMPYSVPSLVYLYSHYFIGIFTRERSIVIRTETLREI